MQDGSGSGGSSGSGGNLASGQRTRSSRQPEIEPGEVLAGQFKIGGQLGRGAVATVYGATDRHLGEEVALKVIPTFGEPEAALRAIRPEYQAVRGLQDGQRHILHIDRPTVCEHSGMDIVLLPMERAEKSFRDWLEETEADPGVEGRLEEGLALLRQACRGVEALHEQGLAHMDLKPENLLLTKNGRGPSEATEWTVKVADFGLARSLRRGEVLNEEVVAEGVGTPYYMAPEQVLAARQEEVGQEADLYALGIILFELLDGKVPFDGSAERVREKHRRVDPPSVRTEVPGRLEELAHRCLAKEAEDRPPSAGAIREELTLETSEERAAFERAREADTIEGWTGFIESYPEGWRTPDAEERLDELKREAEREEWVAEGERLAQEVASAIEKIELDPAANTPGIEAAEEALGQLEEHISSPPPAVEEGESARSKLQERKQSLRARLEEKREALGERRRERQEELRRKAETAIEEENFEEADRLIEDLRSVTGGDSEEADRLATKKEEAREAYRARRKEEQEALIQAIEEAIAEKNLSRAEEKMTALRKEASGKVAVDEAKIERLDRQIEDLRDWLGTRKELVQAARGAIEDENIDRAESKLTELKNHLGSEVGEDEKLADLTDDLDRLREKQKKIRKKIDAVEEAIEEERLEDAQNEIHSLKMKAGSDHSEVRRLREERALKKAKIEREELFEQVEDAIGREDVEEAENVLPELKSHLEDYMLESNLEDDKRWKQLKKESEKLLEEKNAEKAKEKFQEELDRWKGRGDDLTSVVSALRNENISGKAKEDILRNRSKDEKERILEEATRQDEPSLVRAMAAHAEVYPDQVELGSIRTYKKHGAKYVEPRSLLHIAAQESAADAAMALTEAGADPDGDSSDAVTLCPSSRETPLHTAAKHGSNQVARILLDAGADPDIAKRTSEVESLIDDGTSLVGGETPLHVAAEEGNSEVAYRLLEADADTEKTDADGETPLHEAVRSNNPEVVKALLRNGAEVNAKYSPTSGIPRMGVGGRTPLDMADEDSKVARLLRRHGGKETDLYGSTDSISDESSGLDTTTDIDIPKVDPTTYFSDQSNTLDDEPGRNEYVTVRNNATGKTTEMKWKYAKKKVKNDGWTLVS